MANSYLNHETGSTTTSVKLATLSAWVKRSKVSANNCIFGHEESNSLRSAIYFTGDDYLLYFQNGSNIFQTNRKFRDLSAWYHIVIQWDLTQSTASNRVKLYVNGVQETSFSATSYPSQNASDEVPNFGQQTVGVNRYNSSPDLYFDGYMSHVAFVDGQALAPTVFGETDSTSGIWKFKSPSGVTWGTNGFWLKFENSGALGTDSSGQSNTFTVNGNGRQALDTPSNVYATWNSLFRKGTSTPAFSNGNLTSTFDDAGANEFALTTLGASSGKYYAEIKWVSATGTGATSTGILDMGYSGTADPNNAVTNTFAYFGNGNKNVSGSASSYGSSYTSGDIIGIAMDLDNNKLYFSKNGTWQNSGDPTSGATGTGAISTIAGVTYGFMTSDYNNKVCQLNTGNGYFGTTAISSAGSNGNGSLFEYDVPSGYYALNTKNINTYG